MMTTLLGVWHSATVFIVNGERITVYTYQSLRRRVSDLFPFECFVSLEGNVIREYVKR
jgi:hypothetical protein